MMQNLIKPATTSTLKPLLTSNKVQNHPTYATNPVKPPPSTLGIRKYGYKHLKTATLIKDVAKPINLLPAPKKIEVKKPVVQTPVFTPVIRTEVFEPAKIPVVQAPIPTAVQTFPRKPVIQTPVQRPVVQTLCRHLFVNLLFRNPCRHLWFKHLCEDL